MITEPEKYENIFNKILKDDYNDMPSLHFPTLAKNYLELFNFYKTNKK